MGFLGLFKKKEKEFDRTEYIYFSPEEFRDLPDDKLVEAALVRTQDFYDGVRLADADFSDARGVFYTAALYDDVVWNISFSSFLIQYCGTVTKYLSANLRKIGANEHADFFEKFMADNKLDPLEYCSAEMLRNVKEMDFETPFYELPDLGTYLLPYVKKHIDLF